MNYAPPRTLSPSRPDESAGREPWWSVPGSAFALACASAGVGSLLIAVAFTISRQGQWGGVVFWIGFAYIVVPIFVMLCSAGLRRGDRIGLLLLLGLSLFFIKVLNDPVHFSHYDELIHWRTANDILLTGALFNPNPILSVSPQYPGLEILTTAIVNLTGLSIFASGLIVLTLSRVLLILGLFVFFSRLGASERVAGLGVAVYAGSPGFVFFDSQFAYESLAIPLALVALSLVAALRQGRPRPVLALTAALVLAALVVTHHSTSYALLGIFGLWTASSLVLRRPPEETRVLAVNTASFGLMIVGWMLVAAPETMTYLWPIVSSRTQELLNVLTGQSVFRPAFQTYTGEIAPMPERFVAMGAALIVTVAIGIGAWRVYREWRYSAAVGALTLLALALPANFVLRFVSTLSEVANRFANVAYIGVGLVVALALVWLLARPRYVGRPVPLVVAVLVVLTAGGVQMGWGPTFRVMPGEYRVSADAHSVERQGLSAARWAHERLGPDNRITADRINRLLLGSYGRQDAVTKTDDGDLLSPIFFATSLDTAERFLIAQGEIDYVLVDRRLNQELPVVGVYFEEGELNSFNHRIPIGLANLNKFGRTPQVSRIYDGGDISIYDVRRIALR